MAPGMTSEHPESNEGSTPALPDTTTLTPQQIANMLQAGSYGGNEGCYFSCLAHYPEWLVLLQDFIFENLPADAKGAWHVDLAYAIAEQRRDWPIILHGIHAAILRISYRTAGDVQAVVKAVLDLHERAVAGETVSSDEWSAAWDAAADAVEDTAGAGENAALGAAWSAAWSENNAAVEAPEGMAWSTDGAAAVRAVARNAAESAAECAAECAAMDAEEDAAINAAYQEIAKAVLTEIST